LAAGLVKCPDSLARRRCRPGHPPHRLPDRPGPADTL